MPRALRKDDPGPRSLIDSTAVGHRLLSGPFWAELRTFLAVARLGSANRAAEELGLSHTTVGRQLRRLHDVLKDKLVVVSHRGAFLTPKGERLAAALAEMDSLLSDTIASLDRQDQPAKSTVRLRITDGIGFTFVIPALPAFRESHPDIKVSLNRPRPYEDLRENVADIIVGFAADAPSDLTIRKLGCLHMVPFASRGYVERYGADLDSRSTVHQFIDSGRYAAPGTFWKPWRDLVRRGVVSFESDASVTYGVMVKAGLGIGLMPAHNACEPSLVHLRTGWSIGLPLHAVALTDRLGSRPVRTVYEFVARVLGEDQPWLSRELPLDRLPSAPPAGYAEFLNLPPSRAASR